MCYEQLKWLCFEQKRRAWKKAGKAWTPEADKLVSD
jgi:solute carrier family 25 folate transporter 32